jgi:hypothetical protein
MLYLTEEAYEDCMKSYGAWLGHEAAPGTIPSAEESGLQPIQDFAVSAEMAG